MRINTITCLIQQEHESIKNVFFKLIKKCATLCKLMVNCWMGYFLVLNDRFPWNPVHFLFCFCSVYFGTTQSADVTQTSCKHVYCPWGGATFSSPFISTLIFSLMAPDTIDLSVRFSVGKTRAREVNPVCLSVCLCECVWVSEWKKRGIESKGAGEVEEGHLSCLTLSITCVIQLISEQWPADRHKPNLISSQPCSITNLTRGQTANISRPMSKWL